MRVANSLFEEKNTQVLGISTDPRPTQTAFAASLGSIPYPILSDFHPKGQVSQAYGVYNEGRGTANRSVFILDKEGIVRFKQEYSNISELDPKDILSELDKL